MSVEIYTIPLQCITLSLLFSLSLRKSPYLVDPSTPPNSNLLSVKILNSTSARNNQRKLQMG